MRRLTLTGCGGIIIRMHRPAQLKARPGYRLHLVFADGLAGELDLSDMVGRGVFAPLADPVAFARAHIGPQGQIAWTDELEICADAAYREICAQNVAPLHA